LLSTGWVAARNRDLPVVWFSERVGDVTVTRGVLVMANWLKTNTGRPPHPPQAPKRPGGPANAKS
jgi:hypothetical protein